MKYNLLLLVIIMTASCQNHYNSQGRNSQVFFIPASNSIDSHLDSASIEDYILALPIRTVNERTISDFEDRVRKARISKPQNRGAGPDFLYIGGDGSRGLISFRFDQKKRLLYVCDKNWENTAIPPHKYFLYRVPGGWVQSERLLSPDELLSPGKLPIMQYWEGVGG